MSINSTEICQIIAEAAGNQRALAGIKPPRIDSETAQAIYFAIKPYLKRESGWRPIERQELAEECARYFAGYSFSRHEVAQCLGLIDVLISKNLIAKPSKNNQIEGQSS